MTYITRGTYYNKYMTGNECFSKLVYAYYSALTAALYMMISDSLIFSIYMGEDPKKRGPQVWAPWLYTSHTHLYYFSCLYTRLFRYWLQYWLRYRRGLPWLNTGGPSNLFLPCSSWIVWYLKTRDASRQLQLLKYFYPYNLAPSVGNEASVSSKSLHFQSVSTAQSLLLFVHTFRFVQYMKLGLNFLVSMCTQSLWQIGWLR